MSKRLVAVIGMERLIARMERYPARVNAAASDALNKVAGEVLEEAQRLAPVDTGALRASGEVIPARPDALAAGVAFGAEYAMVVHETHATQSKYLERPAREAANDLVDGVRDGIKGVRT